MLTEHNRMRRHEPTNDNEVLTPLIPTEIMHGSLESFNFVYFAVLVIEDV